MKITILTTMLAATVSLWVSGCADPEPRHISTTTTETEVHRPVQRTTVETQQVRPY